MNQCQTKLMFVLERILSVVAPHRCLICGGEGEVICAWCLPDLAPPLPARCYRCRAQSENSLVCKKCRRDSRVKHVWVRTSYEGMAKQLIHDFKFERKQAAAEPLARLMAEALPYLPPETIITHVPTASSRARQRGYDHAELLAKALARELSLPHIALLARTGQARQVGAKRAERLDQLQDAFRFVNAPETRSAPILLVDDLVTTGGTLEAATTCLKQNGVKLVDAVVFAQKE